MYSVHYFVKLDVTLTNAVDVQTNNTSRTRNNTTCTQRVAECVVCQFIAQTTARREAIHLVRHIDKEGKPLCLFICQCVHKSIIFETTFAISQECGGNNRERQQFFFSFLSEPLQEISLQPIGAFNVYLCTIWIVETTKHFFQVIMVKHTHIPKDRLVSSCTCRLIQSIDNTLKFLFYF